MNNEQIDEAIETLVRACNVENRPAVTQALRRMVNSGGEIAASAPNPSVEPVAPRDIRDFQRELANYFDDVGDPHGATMIRNFADLSGYAAPIANPSDKQEAVYQRRAGFSEHWLDVSKEAYDNTPDDCRRIVYAAPLAQSAEQDRIDAERRAEYWKAEHLAGNKEIERLKATLESRVLAERQPVAVIGRDWQLLWASPVSLKEIVDRHNLKIGTPLFAHPTPDDAKLTSNQFAAIRAGKAALEKLGGLDPFGIVLQEMLDAAMQADKESGDE